MRRYERQMIAAGMLGIMSVTSGGVSAQSNCQIPTADSLVNTSTIGSQFNPGIAMDSDGNYVVVWENSSLFDDNIYAQFYDSNSQKIGDQFRINQNATPYNNNPSVAMDNDGNFVVTWEVETQSAPTVNAIYARRFDLSGIALDDAFVVSAQASDQINPDIAMDADGDFVITWQEYLGDWGIFAQRYDAMGIPVGSEFLVNSHTTGDQETPAIAMDDDGDFAITWFGLGPNSPTTQEIYGRLYSKDGMPLSPIERQLNRIETFSQSRPDIAMDDDGDFVATWRVVDFSSDNQIQARRFDAAGIALDASEFSVSSGDALVKDLPQVAIDTDGDFVITWESTGQEQTGGSGIGVFARTFHPSGVPKDASEFQVNSYGSDEQSFPAIALDPDGDFVVAWQSFMQDGSDFGIFSKNYQCCPPSYADASGNQLSGTIHSDTELEAAQLIESMQTLDGGEIHYDAGNCIELLRGFEVKGGTVFRAFIDGCD